MLRLWRGGKLDSQIIGALILLALLIIGALSKIITAVTDKIIADLAVNTKISTEARDSNDGKLAAERNKVQGLLAVIRDREDKIAFLVARVPTATALLEEFSDRRTRHITDSDAVIAEEHALGND